MNESNNDFTFSLGVEILRGNSSLPNEYPSTFHKTITISIKLNYLFLKF